MTEQKIKKTSLTIEDRFNILKRLEDGASHSDLAKEFHVTRQAIYLIKKREKNVKNAKKVLQNCDGDLKRKRYRAIEETILDQKLFEWCKQRQCMGLDISGPIIKKQALLYRKRLGGEENFTASNGWLDRFKKRHGLKQKNIQDEKSANFDEVSYNDQNSCPTDSSLDDNCPTFIEAYQGINTFLQWYHKNGESSELYLTCFQKAHEVFHKYLISKK